MTNNESKQKPNSTSSDKTDDFTRCEAVLELGLKLVDELNLEPPVDTLGRWMAHYIADLINEAENKSGEDKQITEKKCFDTILELWTHRAELPSGKRPFEELEPIIHAIESLNPYDNTPRYHRLARPSREQVKEDSEVTEWLEVVDGIDYSARIIIGYCLTEAARATSDKTKDWVKHALAAGEEDSAYEIVIKYISANSSHENEPDPNIEVRKKLKDRIERLENFIKKADLVATELTTQYEALPPLHEGDDPATVTDTND